MAPLDGIDALFGRAEILGRLAAALDQTARDGRASVIVLTGEAGIGKSRLGREVAAAAQRRGFEVAEAGCWSHGGAPPLWPWREILRRFDPVDVPVETGATRTSEGARRPRFTLSNWPGLATGFGVFEASADRLRAVCERRPLLVTIDDLHEADEGTLLLTRFLAAQLSSSPMVVVATVRSGTVAPGTREAELLDEIERGATVIELPGLSLEALDELARSSGRPADAHVLDALFAITRGNPLVAQSVLRAAPEGPLESTLAASVAEAFSRRMVAVDPLVRGILSHAAVLGVRVRVDEAAGLTGRSPDEVVAAAQTGVQLGVLQTVSALEIAFTHDLVRAALEDSLSPSERANAHAAAARLVARGDRRGAGALPAARHALACAGRSSDDLAYAVDLARSAASSLVQRDAFGDAAALLADVIVTVEGLGVEIGARLQVDHAYAVLAAGRLAEAHRLFLAAAEAAAAERDPVLQAEAAAGLGGIWINNVRSPIEQVRILRLQRAALDALPAGHDGLALRLRSRIAGGAVFWEAQPIATLVDIVSEARTHDDPAVTLEVLSNAHPALLGPAWGPYRLELADEMVALAGDVTGGIYALMARCWRAVDLYLVGSDRADAALAELRGPAEAFQSLSVLYIVRCIETMLSIRAGRLAEAERRASEAFALGRRCEDADAAAYFGVQLLAIRWLQGRDIETLALFEDLAGSANVIRGDQAFNAAVAALAARSGAADVARRYLGRVLDPPGLDGMPRFSTWLAAVGAVIETAANLDDRSLSQHAYELLEPYADLPITPSLAVTCFGSTHLPLGLAARVTGRIDRAVEHFEAAVTANIRLGNLPRAAVARHELAVTLAERARPGDAAMAEQVLAEAIGAGDRLGLAIAEQWRSAAPPVVVPAVEASLDIHQDGSSWVVSFGAERLVLPDRVGLRYLAQLVANPGRDISARSLASGAPVTGPSDRQAVLDRAARQAFEARARELADAIAEARNRGDDVAQKELEDELDAVAGELQRATGLANRDRYFGDEAERARTAVRKAVVRAIAEVAAGLPSAGDHLRATITTGVECRYEPG